MDLFLIVIYEGLVDNEQPFQKKVDYGYMLILRDSDYDVVYTDINVNQIISLQGCFSLQDSEEIKSQSLEKVSY